MPVNSKGAIIRAGKGAETIGAWINNNLDQLQRAMPKVVRADKLARVFVTELQRTQGLLACTPKSLISGFVQASQCGLELGSHLGQAWLVPFKVHGTPTATLIIGYKGFVAMAYASGIVENVQAFDVREADKYEPPLLGTDPKIWHSPVAGRADSEVVAAYAIVRLLNARVPNIEWLWRDETDAVMKRSRAAAKKDSPWHTDYHMMARKTALRRACKYIPQSAETRTLHTAVSVDEQADANLDQIFDIDPTDFTAMPEDEPAPDSGELTEEQARKVFGD